MVGLRDRAVLGVLAYTGARIGAVARLRMADYRNLGDHRVLRFREKGGQDREIPVRHDLAAWLNQYIAAAGIAEEPKAPLFRGADGKRKVLTSSAYRAHSKRQMMKRRLEDAGLPHLFSPHSFRVTVLTDLLNQKRSARRCAVPGRPYQPYYHPGLRPAPAQGHPQYVERISIYEGPIDVFAHG